MFFQASDCSDITKKKGMLTLAFRTLDKRFPVLTASSQEFALKLWLLVEIGDHMGFRSVFGSAFGDNFEEACRMTKYINQSINRNPHLTSRISLIGRMAFQLHRFLTTIFSFATAVYYWKTTSWKRSPWLSTECKDHRKMQKTWSWSFPWNCSIAWTVWSEDFSDPSLVRCSAWIFF